MTTWAAVVGSPITHSLSPVLHRKAYDLVGLDWEYRTYQVDAKELSGFISSIPRGCAGLSVTMPNKRAALDLADVKDGLAKLVGAANTLVPAAGMWGAFNTDVHGIVETVRHSQGVSLERLAEQNSTQGNRALLLGTGATASSALAAVATLGYKEIAVVGRNFQGVGNVTIAARDLGLVFTPLRWERTDLIADWLNSADLVVSTVPGAVSGQISDLATPGPDKMILDVVYADSSALSAGYAKAGAIVLDPLAMLTHQGLAQVKLMSGREAPFDPVYQAVLVAAQ